MKLGQNARGHLMLRYRRLARANINRARSQLARSLNDGNYSPLSRTYYRRSLEYLSLALLAFDKADKLNRHKDQSNGGRAA